MKRVIAILAISLIGAQAAGASDTSTFRQEITPQECTVDTLNTGVSQSVTLQPESCQPLIRETGTFPGSSKSAGETAQATERRRLASTQTAIPEDARPGNQGMFENTIAEPLASWLGIGTQEAPPPVRLAMTSAAFVAVMSVVVDAGFFGLAYTQAVWGSLRKVTGRSIYALLRVFFPR